MTRLLLAASFCLLALPALAQKFDAKLSGDQEVPAKQTAGTGTATVQLDGDKITYEVDYSGLSGPASAAHIHGPADPGANAAVMVPFSNPANPIKGTATLNAQQLEALKSGKTYVNVHTQQNPGGEIRGQLKPAQ